MINLKHRKHVQRLSVVLFVVNWGCLILKLLLPTESVRPEARASQCRNNLKQLALALRNYHDKYGSFPPVYVADSEGRPMHSWRVLLLPFWGDSNWNALYEGYRFDEPWNGPNNSLLHREFVGAYSCPSDNVNYQSPWTSYLAISGPSTIWRHDASVRLQDITDQQATTLCLVEVANSGIHWMEPRDLTLDSLRMAGAKWPPIGTRAEHHSGWLFGRFQFYEFAVTLDGKPFSIKRSATAIEFLPLSTISGGEDCSEFFRKHTNIIK